MESPPSYYWDESILQVAIRLINYAWWPGRLSLSPYRIPPALMKRGCPALLPIPTARRPRCNRTNFFSRTRYYQVPAPEIPRALSHSSSGCHHLEESGEVSGDTFWTCAVDAHRQLAQWMSTWKMQRECAVSAAVVRADRAGHATAPCPCIWGHGHLPKPASPLIVIVHDPAPIARCWSLEV